MEPKKRGRPRKYFGPDIGVEMFGEQIVRFIAGELAVAGKELSDITIDEAREMASRLRREKACLRRLR